ncbi:BPTI/Kunitz domain-containing protein isoform X7 [Fundulus heteroclitus]|uniref:BPTI/Kunitz domain-containing protein isoform X7 n=1 Tax=Fundulus heteroclitus TaxID=8078 RepID=UPI00165BF56D|nr:BPTI/Kunitz domain-containing protein isoform X7 [Fundulus heteroclitus]
MKELLLLGVALSVLHIGNSQKKEFCSLPMDPGQGTNFSFAVYYDHKQDKCMPFFYQGQGGNANRFRNERECLRNCSINSEKTYPMDATAACHLTKQIGGCSGNYLRYYYDSATDRCKKFIWSGCFGNGNRFFDSKSCEDTCLGIHDDSEELEPDTPIAEFCRLPMDPGQGTDFSFAVYYDHEQDKCIPFFYQGQGGNANRFSNERECLRNCSINSEKTYPMNATAACHLTKQIGGCSGNYLRYYYDSARDKCKKFIWSGCFGNGNRFFDSKSCEDTCLGIHDDSEELEPDTPIAEFCRLPMDPGQGTDFSFAVYYDHKQDKCIPFSYQGQGGNANRFSNERECLRNCSINSEKTYPMNATAACHLTKQIGGCSGNYLRYYYDSATDRCKKFIWSGCFGNGNRFFDSKSCEDTCLDIHDDSEELEPDTPIAEFCRLPMDPGQGKDFSFAVYYDHQQDKCIPFSYQGQGGNANRFSNERECLRNCSINSEKTYPMNATAACHLTKQIGGCSGNYLRYYYDSATDRCKKFIWSGCFGNGNRFFDSKSCEDTCLGIHDDSEELEPDTPIAEFCRLPMDPGQGKDFSFAVYYDHEQDKCKPFFYQGQGGNANRFKNERECLRNCSINSEKTYPMNATAACHLTKQIGGCSGNYLRYYYDSATDRCKKFIWSGCFGNGNRFFDSKSCEDTCLGIHDDSEELEPDTPIEFCRLPMDPGQGKDFSFAVYYDHQQDKCIPFSYQGQGGNANRFSNERECLRNCSINSEKTYPMNATAACHLTKQIGGCSGNYLRYYYDSATDRCKKFIWSGCFGNGNRFFDSKSCEDTCLGIHDDSEELEPDTPIEEDPAWLEARGKY